MKKVLSLVVLAVLLTSCASGWSCKKRYVSNQSITKDKNV